MRKRSLFIAAAWLFSASVAAAESGADPAYWTRLLNGEIVAREFDLDGGAGQADGAEPGAVRMQMLAWAPARALWDVIVSCQQAFFFIDGLQACEVLEDRGDRVRVRQVVDQGWLAPRLEFVFESRRQPFERIDVALLSGNLRALEGRWLFEETSSGTLVDHALRIRPEVPLPLFLVRRNVEGSMPDLLACVRALAGGSGSGQRRASDLARCRGPAADRLREATAGSPAPASELHFQPGAEAE